jgi:hypothetical protein
VIPDNVISMANTTENAKACAPVQMIKDAIKDISIGNVLMLDTNNGNYDVGFAQSGMTVSQYVAMLEIAKSIFMLGY